MLNLLEFGNVAKAVFMSALFLVTTIDICLLPNLFLREYKLPTKIFTVAMNIIGFALTVILTTGINADFSFREIPLLSIILLENCEFTLAFIIIDFTFLVFICAGEYKYRKNTVTTTSIKESFDNLPTGLCFSKPNGTVQLVNHKMNELSYLITGEELQNANSFWRVLRNGKTTQEVHRVSEGDNPEFRLKDGTVYTFAREKIEHIFQITATDTTSLHKLTNRLRDSNDELEEMNERLRTYGETVDETTRARERLETKIRIHSELGQALLATRHSLTLPDADYKPVINAWKRNIAVLRTEAEPAMSTDLLQSLIEIAEFAGVQVEIKGIMPYDNIIAELFTSAATEILTNAVRHAQASTLFVEFSELEEYYCATYSNDGNAPSAEIREGGGLGSLRKKIERFEGEMEIQSFPLFRLTVKLPKEVKRYV